MTDVDVRAGQQMEIVGGVARLVKNGEVSREFQIQELPQTFIQWQLDYKRRVYDAIEKDEYIAFNAGHLPVVATLNDEGIIPNLANKGVGFTPKDEYIEHYVKLVEDAVDEIIKLPPHAVDDTRALRIATAREFYKHPEHIDWRRLGLLEIFEDAVEQIIKLPPHAVDETRALRIATAREFYKHPEHIDWRRLGLLEIFEGETYRNLTKRPLASVLWTGDSPVFVSFQVDCAVEIIPKEDARYRFSWAMRRLFEYEPFHVVQTMFPYAYTFWVVGAHDKTPKRRYK